MSAETIYVSAFVRDAIDFEAAVDAYCAAAARRAGRAGFRARGRGAQPEAEALREALKEATRALGSFLWLGNNLHNSGSETFREMYRASLGDARTAYNAGAVINGWKTDE